MKKFARWLYMTLYNDELIKIAKIIRNDDENPNKRIGMFETL